ncbi:phage tail spike protein [Aerococcus urinae]|uniref:phage tail spike protein n=1 Tax=Aerococcus urinae TaxID=1376 RepID=UPI00254CC2CB|nr:phage tail spike protein [Aerococcus urinae]MDK6474488.1 phage tail spike protein [Aerococcus urinae]
MIYLYDGDTRDFKYNGTPLPQAYDVVVEFGINTEYFVTGKIPIAYLKEKGVQKDKIITAHTDNAMQPFRIVKLTKRLDCVEFEAWALLFADMRNKLVKPLTLKQAPGQFALNSFKQSLISDTPFTFTTDIMDKHDYHTQDSNERENNSNQMYQALDVLKDIVNRWNGELYINGYDIRLYNRLGRNRELLLYESKNINEFVDEETIEGIATRLYGKAEWDEEVEGESTGERNKRSIQTMVESPLIGAYSGIIFEKQYTNNDCRTIKELEDWLKRKFTTENIDKPKRNIKVGTNIVQNEELNVGDSLVLKYVANDIDDEIRMVGYKMDGYTGDYISVELGDASQGVLSNFKTEINNITSNVNERLETTTHVMLNGMGNKVIYSKYEPTGQFKHGDIWFDEEGGFYLWDAELADWVEHPFNKGTEFLERKLNEMQEQNKKIAEQAEKDRKNAEKMLDDMREVAERTKQFGDRVDATYNIVGDDGKWVYSKNRLLTFDDETGKPETDQITSNRQVITLEEQSETFSHNGEGWSLGNEYAISYVPEFVERPKASVGFHVCVDNLVSKVDEVNEDYNIANVRLSEPLIAGGLYRLNAFITLPKTKDRLAVFDSSSWNQQNDQANNDQNYYSIAFSYQPNYRVNEWGHDHKTIKLFAMARDQKGKSNVHWVTLEKIGGAT